MRFGGRDKIPARAKSVTSIFAAKGRRVFWGGFAVLLVAAALGGYVVRRIDRLPSPGSPTYEETVRSFYGGMAHLEIGLLDDARRGFTRTTELVPGGPAAWANLGLANIRLGDFETAVPLVQRATNLAPENSEIELLFGQLETSRGRAGGSNCASASGGPARFSRPSAESRPCSGSGTRCRSGR